MFDSHFHSYFQFSQIISKIKTLQQPSSSFICWQYISRAFWQWTTGPYLQFLFSWYICLYRLRHFGVFEGLIETWTLNCKFHRSIFWGLYLHALTSYAFQNFLFYFFQWKFFHIFHSRNGLKSEKVILFHISTYLLL